MILLLEDTLPDSILRLSVTNNLEIKCVEVGYREQHLEQSFCV